MVLVKLVGVFNSFSWNQILAFVLTELIHGINIDKVEHRAKSIKLNVDCSLTIIRAALPLRQMNEVGE